MTDVAGKKNKVEIPAQITEVMRALTDSGFEAHLVGGCVRDLVLGHEPKDWDIATDAVPEEMLDIFEHAHYDNDFGTVRVVNDETEDEKLKVVEVTTYRTESTYSDNRRPDQVQFSKNIDDDLKRRDFTINALAVSCENVSRDNTLFVTRETVTDNFLGVEDLENKIVRTVGDPHDRFKEDALRMLRAVRFATRLNFSIEKTTKEAIERYGDRLKNVAVERIKDEFEKIILSDQPRRGLELCHELGILEIFLPELVETIGVEQNQAHKFDVYEHLLGALQAAADKEWPLHVRLGALFHDISKPEARRYDKNKEDYTFYNHEVIGSRVTKKIMQRMKFSGDLTKQVTNLVRWHMFFSDPDEISLSAVRRLIRNVGKENVWDLMKIRVADRIGMGRPKENPYRLRKYKSMIEEVMRDPITVGMLKIDGNIIINEIGVSPGPKIGHILHALLEEVLEDPEKNSSEYLVSRATELNELPDEKLRKLGDHAQKEKKAREREQIKEIRNKYWVE